jgi:uncharacterized membrane protein
MRKTANNVPVQIVPMAYCGAGFTADSRGGLWDHLSTTKTRQGAIWRELVGLIFLVLLFGAALMANVTDGPMRDHRGAWVTQASK